MQAPRVGQHRQRLAQGGHPTGDQGRTDRLDTIAPEQLQQLQQHGQIRGRQLRKGQPQSPVDLQIHPGGRQPVALPVVAGGLAAGIEGRDGDDPLLLVEAHAPASIGVRVLGPAVG